MNNNHEGLDFSIADCQQIEKEFTKKAATLTNFFTNRTMKAEAVKQVIARADDFDKVKILYDEGKREPDKKPSRIKRTVITAVATAALMGAAYFGALAHFGRQDYEAQIQGLNAEKQLVVLRKKNADEKNLERIAGLQENYAGAIRRISEIENVYDLCLGEKNQAQKQYASIISERNELQKAQAKLNNEYLELQQSQKQTLEALRSKEKEYSTLEQAVSALEGENQGLQQEKESLQQGNTELISRIFELADERTKAQEQISELKTTHTRELEAFVEQQITQRTQKYGSYSTKGPFSNFVSNYAEFFFGKPNEQQKELIDRVLRKYVKTDGKSIDETIQGWNCNTIILRYNNKPEIIDP